MLPGAVWPPGGTMPGANQAADLVRDLPATPGFRLAPETGPNSAPAGPAAEQQTTGKTGSRQHGAGDGRRRDR